MKSIVMMAAVALVLSGCAGVLPNKGGMGSLYLDAKDSFLVSTGTGGKTGRACQQNILGAYTTGDASVEAAKKAGGIKNIASVDNEYKNILGVYSTYCTVATGN